MIGPFNRSVDASPLKWVVLITLCFGLFQFPFAGFMADDFLDHGYGPDDTLEAWAHDPSEGPVEGIIINSISIS